MDCLVCDMRTAIGNPVLIIGGNKKYIGQTGLLTRICSEVYPFHYGVLIDNGEWLVWRGDEIKEI